MAHAVQRQTVASSNLANIDTPGYRTQEPTFEDALDDSMGATLSLTSSGHQAGAASAGADRTRDVEGLAYKRDGNNVQLDRELLSLTSAAGDFSKAQTALAAKFRLVRYAINEGR